MASVSGMLNLEIIRHPIRVDQWVLKKSVARLELEIHIW